MTTKDIVATIFVAVCAIYLTSQNVRLIRQTFGPLHWQDVAVLLYLTALPTAAVFFVFGLIVARYF